MDIDALRTFLAIHRAGTITGAASVLFRSQPALSRRLALLEAGLGAPLFERVPGGLMLSEAGHALLPFAEKMLATLTDAEAAVRAVRAEDTGPVRIALVGTLASTDLTSVLRRFALRHPGVELILRTATSREVSELVRRADVQVGLRYHRDPSPDLHSETLFTERLVVAAAPEHPFAGTRCAGLHELGDQRWLAFPEPPGRPEVSAAYGRRTLEDAGITSDRLLRIDSLTAQKRLIEAGFGIALVPDSSIREELAAGSLVVLDVAGLDLTLEVAVLTRRDGYLGAATRTLLAELHAHTP